LQPSPLSAPPAPYYLQNRNKSKQTNGSPKMEMAEAVFFSKIKNGKSNFKILVAGFSYLEQIACFKKILSLKAYYFRLKNGSS
jgi:hypothetical protein